MSKKSLSDELFLHFSSKVQNLTVFSIVYMIRIRFFGPRELIQKIFRRPRYAVARAFDPTFAVWRGDATLPTEDQGVTILGTPLGHGDFVVASLQAKSREHDALFDLLVGVPDEQCVWLCVCCSCSAHRPEPTT